MIPCGRKFFVWRDIGFMDSLVKSLVICGDNLSHSICPQCKIKKDAEDKENVQK